MLGAFLGALFAVAGLILLMLNTRWAELMPDTPNERSLHTRVVPRTGGLAIMLATVGIWWWQGVGGAWWWALVLLMLLSALDDWRGLSISIRMSVHLLVCASYLAFCIPAIPIYLYFLTLFGLVWMLNLYNFMDGSNGLAGGMGVIGFSAYAYLAFVHGNPALASVCITLSGAYTAFLLFNFNPARIFMGDAGSIPSGFLAGAIGIYGWQYAIWSWWFPILVFSPFILDATVTLIKRLLNHEKIWEAHRTHYYQKLVQMGLGHSRTAIYEYGLMLACGITALYLESQSIEKVSFVLTAWILIYSIIMWKIDDLWARYKHN